MEKLESNYRRFAIGRFIVLAASIHLLVAHGWAVGAEVEEGTIPRVVVTSPLGFKHPSFTFVRIRYSAGRPGIGSWATDFPDADIHFSRRFELETGLKANPDCEVLDLLDPALLDRPFIYVAEGGEMQLNLEEAANLRRYLLQGGFLMVDDFWGAHEWESLRSQIKKAFPDREPIDLPITHPVLHCFYDLKEKPQVPNVGLGIESLKPESPYFGVTWERTDAREAHYRGLLDDQGRLMAIFCHNTDLGDGWERGEVDEGFYREFSLKRAFPMGINIVVHALTR